MSGWHKDGAVVQFIEDRLLEDEAANIATYSGTLLGAFAHLNIAWRRFNVELLAEARRVKLLRPIADSSLHAMAVEYDQHPDFSEWWRP